MQIVIFYILAYVSEIIGTIGGFGSSVFLIPLAGFFFDFHTVLAITGILHVFSNSSKLWLFHKGINKRLLILIGVPSIIFVIIGSYLSAFLFLKYAELILGVFLIAFSVLFYIKPNFKFKPNKFNAISGGSLAGFLAGLVGTGGAVRGLSLAAFSLEKNALIATSAAIDLGVDFSRTIVYLYSGFLAEEFYTTIPFLVVIAVLGSYTGKVILKYVSELQFKKVVLFCVFSVGVVMLWKTIQA